MHKDWVRDVAWAPLSGSQAPMIASCSEDKPVQIWTQSPTDESWSPTLMHAFDQPVWCGKAVEEAGLFQLRPFASYEIGSEGAK